MCGQSIGCGRLKHKFSISLILSSFILLLTAHISWNYYDVQWWLEWTEFPPHQVYAATKNPYMPSVSLFFSSLYEVAERVYWLVIPLGLEGHFIDVLRVVEKLPLIACILTVGIVLYCQEGWNAFKWWCFGLPVYAVFWGYQFDHFVTLFMLLGLYALCAKRYVLSGLLLGLGSTFKLVPFVLIPLALKVIKTLKRRLLFSLAVMIPTAGILIPFLLASPADLIQKVLIFHGNRYPQELSLWNVPQLLSGYTVFNPMLKSLWIVPFLVVYAFLLWRHRGADKQTIFKSSLLILLAFILLNKVGNPPYFLWAYPLLVWWIGSQRSCTTVKTSIFLISLVGFVIHPCVLYIPAASLGENIFIVEDLAYWDARFLYLKSFEGV